MEDTHIARTNLGDVFHFAAFGVFDGHAGKKISEHLAANLLDAIMQTPEFQDNDIVKGIHSGFLKLDNKMRELPELASGADKSGSTAVCAFISNENIYIANCG